MRYFGSEGEVFGIFGKGFIICDNGPAAAAGNGFCSVKTKRAQ